MEPGSFARSWRLPHALTVALAGISSVPVITVSNIIRRVGMGEWYTQGYGIPLQITQGDMIPV